MAAPIRAKGDVFTAVTPTALFQTRLDGACTYCTPNYDVTEDGRFLMTVVVEEASSPPINLVLNWSQALKQRVPTR